MINKLLIKILLYLPILILSLLIAETLNIALSSIFKSYNFVITIALFLFSLIFISISLKENFKPNKIYISNFLIFTFYLVLIIIRFPIFVKAADDINFHLILGWYGKHYWSSANLLPTVLYYSYPLIQLIYKHFWFAIGLRMSLITIHLLFIVWFISLNIRFKNLVNKTIEKKLFIDILFTLAYFWPHLMATHGSYMPDFPAVVISLEAIYQFISPRGSRTLALILVFLAGGVKQSSVFYLIPVFIYFIFKNLKKINWIYGIGFVLVFSAFFIRQFIETGNPLMGLFNNIFESPLYPSASNAGIVWNAKYPLWTKFLWSVLGQFYGFAEGFVSKWARYFFAPFTSLPFFLSILFIFKSKKHKILFASIFISILLWSFYLGNGRYFAPLLIVSWVLIIIYWPLSLSINFKFLSSQKTQLTIISLIGILSFSSIKTDFGWRPIHYLPAYKKLYIEGLQMIGKDRAVDVYNYYKDYFKGYDAVFFPGPGNERGRFVAFLANMGGIPVYVSKSPEYYEGILKSDKVGENIKKVVRRIDSFKVVLLVADEFTKFMDEHMENSYIGNNFKCQRLIPPPESNFIQMFNWGWVHPYKCVRISK